MLTNAAHACHCLCTETYSRVVLYTPRGKSGYMQRNMKQTTRNQLVSKLRNKGYDTVMIVDSMPLRLLGPDSDKAEDIDEVELFDGVQLAVVVDVEHTPFERLDERLSGMESMVSGFIHACCPFLFRAVLQQASTTSRSHGQWSYGLLRPPTRGLRPSASNWHPACYLCGRTS
jgi:hypothetical protein